MMKLNQRTWFLCALALGCIFMQNTVLANPFAEVKAGDWVVIQVDPDRGSDQAGLKSKQPLRTLKEAVRRANSINKPVRIQLKPGIYREGGITISPRQQPIAIEGVGGEAVISGADIWSDWKKEGRFYVADWPYDWGEADLVKLDYFERDRNHMKPLGKRSEMVFVDDQLLKQVETKRDLTPGTFAVDEEADEIYMMPPKRTNMKKALIEVSVRPHLFAAFRVKGLSLRQLVFTKACSGNMHPSHGSWTVLLGGEHPSGDGVINSKPDRDYLRVLYIDQCRFEWNNASGMTIANIVGGKITNSKFNNNGAAGIGANRLREIVYEDCQLNGNNWRFGGMGDVYGHSPAGTKHLFADQVTFRRCEFNHNLGCGLWLDFGNENIVVEDCEMINNSHVGFYFEASYGPALLKNSKVMHNGMGELRKNSKVLNDERYDNSYNVSNGGVLFAESMDLTIERCVIAYNANFQVGVRSRARKSSGYWSRKMFDGQCKRLTLKNSVLVGAKYTGDARPSWFVEKHLHAALITNMHSEVESYQRFLTTYKGSRNAFYYGGTREGFGTGPQNGYVRIDFKEWQKLTGQDRTSVWRKVSPKIMR